MLFYQSDDCYCAKFSLIKNSEMFKIFRFSSGIGHMVGAGIFVLTGTVVKDEAGPAAVLSYFFAGIGALLSSLCYAEFGAKVPKVKRRHSVEHKKV